MADKQARGNPDDPNAHIEQTRPAPKEDSLSDNKKANPLKYRSKKGDNIIVNLVQPKSNQPKIANVIAGIAAFISLCLGVITLFLFIQTERQAQSSIDAAKIARETLDSTKSYNKQSAKNQKIELKKGDSIEKEKFKRDTATFNLQKKALDAQIISIKKSENNFERENQPYLVANSFKDFIFQINQEISFNYYFYNYGKQPIKLIKFGSKLMFVPKNDSTIFFKNPYTFFKKSDSDVISEYIINGYPNDKHFKTQPLTKNDLDSFTMRKRLVYFIGRADYINNLNGKKRRYDFIVKFDKMNKNGMDYWFVSNENYDIK